MRKSIGASEGSSIYLLGICAGSLLAVFSNLIFTRVNAGFDGMSVRDWVGYLVIQIGFIASVFIYARVRRIDEVSLARMRGPRSVKQLFLTPVIAIAAILVFLPLANLWDSFLGIIHYHGPAPKMPAYSNVGVYFLSLLVMSVIPAFGEELIMRGNVFHGLSSRGVWFGIIFSALFFSLMHASPIQTVHQFGLGMVLAIVMILTDSLWSCVLVHFFNNFISITLTAYLPQVQTIYLNLGYFNWLVGAASVIVGLFILVLALYAMYRLSGRDDYKLVEGGIEYEGFTIYADSLPEKSNPVKDFFAFFGSLFTKKGWKRLTRVLASENEVEYIGKAQPMIGVWLALGLVAAYWLYGFIAGLI